MGEPVQANAVKTASINGNAERPRTEEHVRMACSFLQTGFWVRVNVRCAASEGSKGSMTVQLDKRIPERKRTSRAVFATWRWSSSVGVSLTCALLLLSVREQVGPMLVRPFDDAGHVVFEQVPLLYELPRSR